MPLRTVLPDKIEGTALAALLRPRLLGTPIGAPPPVTKPPDFVVWVDGHDEVLVHLDSIATRIVGTCVLVSIDLETDQTGRTPLVVAFAIDSADTGGLVAATDQLPRGNGALASRWGTAVRDAAWSALLSLAADHAAESGGIPRGWSIADSHLALRAGPALTVQ